MDTLTHGLTGALIGKGLFAGRDAPEDAGKRRVAVLAATLGSVFPDLDVIFGRRLTGNDLAIIEFHRGVTHSLVCLPVWAVLLALLTRWITRRRGLASPSWGLLAVTYGAGIASHILLDLITSFGTMVWSPLSYRRVQWDLTFIIDLLMMSIVLLPHMLARIYRGREGSLARAARAWSVFALLTLGTAKLLRVVEFPISLRTMLAALLVFAGLFFAPRWGGWGFRMGRSGWARAGLAALAAYLGLCAAAHHAARQRVEQFAARRGLRVEQLAALPMPPSPANWDGLVLTPEGVYEARLDLLDSSRELPAFRFVADAPPNGYIEAARQLPKTQVYLWFARFPVYRFSDQGNRKIVEISDLRFFARRGRPASFTFRVTFDAAGRVLQQGLVRMTP